MPLRRSLSLLRDGRAATKMPLLRSWGARSSLQCRPSGPPPVIHIVDMRFKAVPFTHPDYEALQKRSKALSLVWGIGHITFVVFLAMAFAVPFGIMTMILIDPEILKDRVWDVGGGSVAAALLVAGIGFAAKWYASWKGKDTGETRE